MAARSKSYVIFCCVFVVMVTSVDLATAQRIDFTYRTYGLEVDDDNIIRNNAYLDDFFEKLYQLSLSKSGHVNIVHIGDSHVQADYMTSIVRRNFHRHFGNAGRGLIVPLRVARTNEPNNFRTSSRVVWRSKRCVFPEQPLPIGVGGVTIETNDEKADLDINMNDLWLDYGFNTMTLLYRKDAASFNFSVRASDGRELAAIRASDDDALQNHSHAAWDEKVNAVSLRCVKNAPGQNKATIFGMVLGNSASGVKYHSIGVNGAKYKHYDAASYFSAQTAALQPDLFIISLGTNESIDYPNIDRMFVSHVDRLVMSLQKANPSAKFLLVTPQAMLRKNKLNPGVAEIRHHIISYAVEHGLAFYDLYRATGGEHSARAWTDRALLSQDGVHLTKDGYEYQGDLFYHALLKSYNSYVPDRHP